MSIIKEQTEIQTLTDEIRKLNHGFSWHQSLLRGIVSGFGTAIGAGLLVAMAALVFEHLTGLPLFGGVFDFLAQHLPRTK